MTLKLHKSIPKDPYTKQLWIQVTRKLTFLPLWIVYWLLEKPRGSSSAWGGLGKERERTAMGGVTFFLSTLLSSEHIALAQEFVSSVVPGTHLLSRKRTYQASCIHTVQCFISNALCPTVNGSCGIKDFGTLPLFFSTSKYFRWKFSTKLSYQLNRYVVKSADEFDGLCQL